MQTIDPAWKALFDAQCVGRWKRSFKRISGTVSGELGGRKNPICCYGAAGQRDYLNRLRGEDCRHPVFSRITTATTGADGVISIYNDGSYKTGPYGTTLDKYLVTSPGMSDREVYMDMYHPKYEELRPIPGYRIFNLGAGKFDLTPPGEGASLQQISNFGVRLGKASRGDASTLQQFLGLNYSVDDCSQLIVFGVSLIVFSYGKDREKVVDALVRNPSLHADVAIAELVYTFIVGE